MTNKQKCAKDNIQKKTMIRLALIICAVCSVASAQEGSFYKQPHGVFSTRPSESKSLQKIKRFGPVGMGIDLLQPAFVMRISHVEEGSPAAAADQLKAGQIIESINGEKLAEIDPRIQLGKILAKAEATDGIIRFAIKGQAEPIEVKVPVLGAYSETWPLNCPKSDKIVRQAADYLAGPNATEGLAGIGMLFLLSTGDSTDLEVVQRWARKLNAHRYPWYIGYGGIGLCEYYLRTGDEEVFSTIQELVDNAVQGQYLDGWMGRGGVSPTYGNGHLNAAGTLVVAFYLLAKECGADVPDHALYGSLVHFYRYAGRGGNPYGDNRTEVGFVDNGKNGLLAFAMAAAAALTPNGEKSVYAAARDSCAMQSFYTTSFMLHGHTGGGIGEIWRSAAMGLLHDKRPKQYREFMDNRQWHYDLSRRFDGSFGILGGAGYDKELWGVAYPLAYTIPRKTLRITGAAPTQFSKPFELPKQPWGTKADNIFLSLKAVPDANGKMQDLTNETLAEDSSMPFLRRFHGEKQPTDGELRRYMHHQDHNIRFVAANKVLGVNSGYIGWRSPGGKVRSDLVLEFLQHNDPRVRRAMYSAIDKRSDVLNQQIFDLAIQSVKDEQEAWSVKDFALQVIGHAPADWIVPHVDSLLPYLQHQEWWLQNAALKALTPVAADERTYQKVLPPMGELVRNNQRTALTAGLMPGIRARIKQAGPKVQQLAIETLRESFTGYAGVRTAQGGQDVSSTFDAHLKFIASSLADVPGGLDVLYKVARERHPNEILPYKEFFLNADPKQFGPKLKQAITPIITEELIPEFVGRNRSKLQPLASAEVQSGYPGGSRDAIDGLVALYNRAGQDEFEWHMWADLRSVEWSYYSFDPIADEHVPFDQLITRYRNVTLPDAAQNWFAKDFEPASKGWKRGKSPFGHYMGKLPTRPIHKCGAGCTGPGCFGATPINSFWEKEVLLMQGTFELPAIKDGHRYRLRVNDGNHVGSGGGHIIYLNGNPLIESKTCNGRGAGGLPKGAYITSEFLEGLDNGKASIAVMTFLRFNDKYKVKPSSRVPQGKISVHLEEQKLPPMGDDLVLKSATLVPMLSSEWQAAQDPDDRERQASAVKFRYDGKFIPNPNVPGKWSVVSEVAEITEFDPSKKPRRANRPPFSSILFKKDGKTNNATFIWSGDILMDLNKYQALRMTTRDFNGVDYLFVEVGGFSTRHKPDWKSRLYVLKRTQK